MIFKKAKKKSKILVLIDWDNLLISTKTNEIKPTHFSIEAGFNQIIKKIIEIGEIIGVFVFLPPNNAMIWGEQIHQLGFKMIVCPRIKDKKGEDQDTVDKILIETGEWLINQITDLTHICLASGDKDFVPFLRKAKLKGLKIIIVAASRQSLAWELKKIIDNDPLNQKKMLFLFRPEED